MGVIRAANFLAIDAAADFLGPGAQVVPVFQTEILDMVRRRGMLGRRMKPVRASGHPSRYFEQTRIVQGIFQDPRNLRYTPTQDPTRRERYVRIKAIYASIGFSLFDVETSQQQGLFPALVEKDLEDSVQGNLRTSDQALWHGIDTSLETDTGIIEYVGGLTQINRTATIASSAKIIDGLKAEVAAMVANQDFEVMPTAVYVNPILGDLMDQEERLNHRQMPQTVLNTVTGGLLVNALATQAGHLPIIADPFLRNGTTGASTTESGKTDYKAVILSEPLVEFHYITAAEPRVFQLGQEGGLATRYAVVQFGAPVFKGKANASQSQGTVESGATTYAHTVVTVVR